MNYKPYIKKKVLLHVLKEWYKHYKILILIRVTMYFFVWAVLIITNVHPFVLLWTLWILGMVFTFYSVVEYIRIFKHHFDMFCNIVCMEVEQYIFYTKVYVSRDLYNMIVGNDRVKNLIECEKKNLVVDPYRKNLDYGPRKLYTEMLMEADLYE